MFSQEISERYGKPEGVKLTHLLSPAKSHNHCNLKLFQNKQTKGGKRQVRRQNVKLTSSQKSCWQRRQFGTVSGGASCFTPSPLQLLRVSLFSFFLSLEPSLVALLPLPLPPSCISPHSKVDKSERRSRGAAAVFRLRLYNNAHGSGTARSHRFISCRAVAVRALVTW